MTRPSELDWSDPNRTPRLPASPDTAARQGSVSSGAPHPLTGSLADYDGLTQALAAYEAACAFGGQTGPLYGALMDASSRCGRPFGTPALGWSTRRVNTYRNMIGA